MSKSIPALMDDNPAMRSAQYWQGIMPYLSERGKIIGCAANLQFLLDNLGVVVRYNVISKSVEINIPGKSFSIDNKANVSLAWVTSQIKQIGMDVGFHREFLGLIADENQFNPVQQWIEHRPWDGVRRLKQLYDTIDAKNNEAKEIFIYRWMVGAVAMACSPGGIDSPGILVLQGTQNMGKTWWFRKLVPSDQLPNVTRADAGINPHDKDSVDQAICNWLVELGELDGIFKKAEVAALKSFITREFDMYRKPFAPGSSKYPRRTAFMASVNPVQYLTDETGNRRYWTIACKKINSYYEIDMQQIWAEVYRYWRDGESWKLTDVEKAMVDEINEDHMTSDPIIETILNKYDWSTDPTFWRWMTSTQILEELKVQRITKTELRICANIVRKINGDKEKRDKMGRMLLMPQKRGVIWDGQEGF